MMEPFTTVLDIGCGDAEAAIAMVNFGKDVTAVDFIDPGYGEALKFVRSDYMNWVPREPFDAIWCSHCLEHQINTGRFITKIFNDLKEGGVLAITVPPLKHEIVSGHVTLWNGGLLLYVLAKQGFDMRLASVKKYGYNISVVVRKVTNQGLLNGEPLTGLADFKEFLPEGLEWDGLSFNGDIDELNW